jgi:hypothetical protein
VQDRALFGTPPDHRERVAQALHMEQPHGN